MSSSQEPSKRRYPRRVLRGPITVTHSARLRFPKFHMVADCDSLERTPVEARATRDFASPMELALSTEGRPCRNCTLESVLITALKAPSKADPVFVTTTSQANPLDPGASVWKYKWSDSTESGRARVERLAQKANLPLAHTGVGPALYGFVSPDAAQVLRFNLRTQVVASLTELPDRELVETVWTLLGDNPPELAGSELEDDPWVLAEALVG